MIIPTENVAQLSSQTPLAEGNERYVFQDPFDAYRVIKVLKADDDNRNQNGFRGWTERRFSGVRTRSVVKEQLEGMRICLRDEAADIRLPFANLFGFCATDIGVGSVSEKVSSPDGSLARSVAAVAKSRALTLPEVHAMSDFAQRFLALGVRAGDLRLDNLAMGHRGAGGQSGPLEVVLVDGLGDIHAIPVRTWSKRANRASTTRRLRRMGRQAGLIWDETKLAYDVKP